MDGTPISLNGTDRTTRITRRLEWNAPDDWKITTTHAAPLDLPHDVTLSEVGSYEQLDGRTLTRHNAMFDSTTTRQLDPNTRLLPAPGFSNQLVGATGVTTRTDGVVVIVDAYVCDGANCDDGATGASGHTAQGRLFDEWGHHLHGRRDAHPAGSW